VNSLSVSKDRLVTVATVPKHSATKAKVRRASSVANPCVRVSSLRTRITSSSPYGVATTPLASATNVYDSEYAATTPSA
jgi:hypothetical protein